VKEISRGHCAAAVTAQFADTPCAAGFDWLAQWQQLLAHTAAAVPPLDTSAGITQAYQHSTCIDTSQQPTGNGLAGGLFDQHPAAYSICDARLAADPACQLLRPQEQNIQAAPDHAVPVAAGAAFEGISIGADTQLDLMAFIEQEMHTAALEAVAAPDTAQAAAFDAEAAASFVMECPAVTSHDMRRHETCLLGKGRSLQQLLLAQGAAGQAVRQPYCQHLDQHVLPGQPLAYFPHPLTNSVAAATTSVSDVTSMDAAEPEAAQLGGGSARLHELAGYMAGLQQAHEMLMQAGQLLQQTQQLSDDLACWQQMY
jgi:hypothetical protein